MTVAEFVKVDNAKERDVPLDEAMLQTGFGTFNIMHMLLSGSILMGMIMQCLSLGYVMPAAQCDLELTLQQRGWLAANPFLAIILTSYFWGYLADTRGRRLVMLASLLLSSLFSVAASLSPNLTTFAVFQFISSIFTSGPSAVGYTYLGEFNSIRHRDKMVAFGSSFVGIGTIVLPAISWVILPLDFYIPLPALDIAFRPWRLLVIACAMPFVLQTLLLFLAPESPKFLFEVGRHEECLKVLRLIYSINYRRPKDSFPVKSLRIESSGSSNQKTTNLKTLLHSMKEQTIPLFKKPLALWTFLACFVQFGIFATTNGFYIWFPTILNALASHEGVESGICSILNSDKYVGNGTTIECTDSINTETFERSIYIGLVFSSMYFIVGFLVDFLGKRTLLIVILTITGCCGILAHVVTSSQTGVVLFAIFQMSGACIGLMNAVSVELFPTKHRAMAVCLSMMLGRVGSMAGSNLIGVFLHTNCGLSFYISGGIVIMNGLFCFMLPTKKQISSPSKDTTRDLAENEISEPV